MWLVIFLFVFSILGYNRKRFSCFAETSIDFEFLKEGIELGFFV